MAVGRHSCSSCRLAMETKKETDNKHILLTVKSAARTSFCFLLPVKQALDFKGKEMESDEQKMKELEIKLRHLEEEYKLAKSGLKGGLLTSAFAIVAVVGSLVLPTAKMQILSGNNVVAIVGIVAAAIVIYFSFIYRRIAAVKFEISKTKIALEMGSSGKAK